MIIKGGQTSQIIIDVLKDIVSVIHYGNFNLLISKSFTINNKNSMP